MDNTMMDWKAIPWHKLERNVFKLQKRIFKASQRGDGRTVRHLQKTLMRSWSAKCMAVRKVTQDNQGKKTAGVDGVKDLSPTERLTLVSELTPTQQAKPTRRVWIPKPGSQEKRPLGIPTMKDRALQALTKQALEPEWEARFEPNSYGFRPGRSAHDAIEAIFKGINRQSKYVLDADIAKCFDRINHQALLRKLNTYPILNRLITRWLKAGYMDSGTLFPTTEGTPQGGVISPLLANIALHGMETYIRKAYPKRRIWQEGKSKHSGGAQFIRYADDFVILHEDIEVIRDCQKRIGDWLMDMGLELKTSKTKITHTLHEHEGNVGFDFLGFTIRQFPVGKHRSGTNSAGKLLGFKTLITPSETGMQRHRQKLKRLIKTHKASTQEVLIGELNPVIRGWSNYYATAVSKYHFAKLDHWLFIALRSWALQRHSNKPTNWIMNKYWLINKGGGWRFASHTEKSVRKMGHHADTPIKRHVKVKGDRSPYDGDWVYWSTRMGKHPQTNQRVAQLLKRQEGRCSHCKLFFKSEDILEVDHLTPRSKGGKDEYENLQLLHRHCHDTKTALDKQSEEVCMTDTISLRSRVPGNWQARF